MPEPLSLQQFNHVARLCKNPETSKRFYMEVLGCREISRPPFSFEGSWLFIGGIQIHLIEEPNAPDGRSPDLPRESHMAFSVENATEAEHCLIEHGVEYRKSIIPGRNIQQIFFRDPDGWLIEVGSPYWTIDQ